MANAVREAPAVAGSGNGSAVGVTSARAGGFWRTVVVFTVATWLAAGALLVLQPALHLNPELLMLTQFGPSAGVLVVVVLRRRASRALPYGAPAAPALAPVLVSLRPTRQVLARCAAGAGLLAALFGLCLGGLALGGRPPHLTSPGSVAGPFWLLAALQWIGACGEELGWRAFLQRHLESRYSTLLSAVVVGLLWGTWHVEYYGFGAAFFAAFMVMTVALSVILGVLVKGAGAGALLVAGTFHWLVNLGILLLLDFERGNLVNMASLAACAVVVALGVRGYERGLEGRRGRATV
ncbi:CPBP family intramembrane glutamic endopeptidase [Streptomyces sp. 150FB]|uniref:CPBP family intramembrane glutamic endopeptidase n=1 Tax=Streptomyces sp. 150FB TaxID=1576605 RepID=UPI000697FF6F|nr:CPBP family intramembrane glutamic endopeptidase [Streptomyces sp. 150FB]